MSADEFLRERRQQPQVGRRCDVTRTDAALIHQTAIVGNVRVGVAYQMLEAPTLNLLELLV
jgi:hypothetical protein